MVCLLYSACVRVIGLRPVTCVRKCCAYVSKNAHARAYILIPNSPTSPPLSECAHCRMLPARPSVYIRHQPTLSRMLYTCEVRSHACARAHARRQCIKITSALSALGMHTLHPHRILLFGGGCWWLGRQPQPPAVGSNQIISRVVCLR